MRIAILKVIEEPRPLTVDLVVLGSTEAPTGLIGELDGVWFVMLVINYRESPRDSLMTGLIQVLSRNAFEDLTRPVTIACLVDVHVWEVNGDHVRSRSQSCSRVYNRNGLLYEIL